MSTVFAGTSMAESEKAGASSAVPRKIDPRLCLVCQSTPRLRGRRLCANTSCAQDYIRACAFCRSSPALGSTASGGESSIGGRFCSLKCQEAQAARIATPMCLRPVCKFFVEGNFDAFECPHGDKCWDFHPPEPVAPPAGVALVISVPSSHVTRTRAYLGAMGQVGVSGLDHCGFRVLSPVLASYNSGQPVTGRKADKLLMVQLPTLAAPSSKRGAVAGDSERSLAWWKALLALAEDANLQRVVQSWFPLGPDATRHLPPFVGTGAIERQETGLVSSPNSPCCCWHHRLAEHAFEHLVSQVQARATRESVKRSADGASGVIKVRLHAKPESVKDALEAWFAAHAGPSVEVAAQGFDVIASALYVGEFGTYWTGIRVVPREITEMTTTEKSQEPQLPASTCHCLLSRAPGGRRVACNKPVSVPLSDEYLRRAFLRRLWLSQESVDSQSHRLASSKQTSVKVDELSAVSLPIVLRSAVSRAFWKLAEVFCTTPIWRWVLQAASLSDEKVVGMDLGASPGGWSYQLAQWCTRVLAIDPGAMATPVPPNVVHIPLTVEAAVVATAEGESPPLVAAMEGGEGGNAFHAHICVCDINAAPSKTLQAFEAVVPLLRPGCGVVLTFKSFVPANRGSTKPGGSSDVAPMDKSAVLEARRKRKQQKKERKQAAKRGRRGSRQKQGQTTHQKQAPEDLNQPTSDGPNADAGSEAHREKQRGDLGSAMGAAVEETVATIATKYCAPDKPPLVLHLMANGLQERTVVFRLRTL